MKNTIIIILVLVFLGSVISPSLAVTVFNAIPENYYVPLLAGAAAQGYLVRHSVAPLESYYIIVGVSVAKEILDTTFFGKQFDWTEAATATLGASFVYFF